MADEPKLAPEWEKLRTTQSYGAKPRIDGVEVVELRRFVEEGGELAEVARLGPDGTLAAFPGFRLRQVNFAAVEPGAVKAWHVHFRQADVWFVLPDGKLLVGLLDTREGSPTKGVSMRVTLGAGRATLLLIPRGVAHGSANLWTRPANVVYLHDAQFDANDPDEHRLPWDALGKDFWSVPPG